MTEHNRGDCPMTAGSPFEHFRGRRGARGRRIGFAAGALLVMAGVLRIGMGWSLDGLIATTVYLFLLALVLAFVWCIWLLGRELLRRMFPNYLEAAIVYAPRDKVRGWGGWIRGYLRQKPGGALEHVQLKPTEDGVLLRHLSGMWTLPRLFIPWRAFSNPRKVTPPWYVSLVGEEHTELQVEGVQISVLLAEEVWLLAEKGKRGHSTFPTPSLPIVPSGDCHGAEK